jgi:hypothetical protein
MLVCLNESWDPEGGRLRFLRSADDLEDRPQGRLLRAREARRRLFGLLRECLDKGAVTEQMLREEMRRNHICHDAFELLDRTQPLAA